MAAPELSRQPSSATKGRAQPTPLSKGKDIATDQPFEPCAATASIFLFAQGSTVLCLHYDTLAVERRFQKHTDNILFIAVDNVSETGAGRLVVTYDACQTAIVWDILTGEQISRFASYEPLKVASWMRNGNIAFGNAKGEVILFEPSTSEHVSARTIFDPITAIAPSSDCKTYAIGYNNGSILLAALQPTFTILHTLTTSRAPSPIVSLTWHASSSKQKSDMLATQTADGDLRVWSVSKPPAAETPRVIRVLKRPDTQFLPGRTWISWSKNGRIIQFSESETWAWDVRTKNITWETLPIVDGVRAITGNGPNGVVFTLGPDYTVQQYEVETAQMVKNVRHIPTTIPPTPPDDNRQLAWTTSESDEELPSPLARARQDLRTTEAARAERNQMASPQSGLSGTTTNSKHSKLQKKDIISPSTRTDLTGTTFSNGNQLKTSQSPNSSRSNRKTSRLRQEVIMSPEERPVHDLFPYTRARLSDVPYRPPRSMDETRMTPDDLRRQMLSVVFGWEEDIHDLVRDELSRHPIDSANAVFLSKWLDEDPDYLAEVMGSATLTPTSDWMLLALGITGHHANSKKITQVFVEKMLSRGDIHAAATLLFAVGDRSDAIEVYVSRNQFLEAVLLTCIVSPSDWQRQSHLVRKWGEHVVENSQQQLAIRCFSCTGVEPTDPWTSPTAQMATRPTDHSISQAPHTVQLPQYPEIFQKTLERRRTVDAPTPIAMPAPPTPFRTAASQGSRITPQTSALKLITSFGQQQSNQFKFPGLKSDDHTPTYGAAVTPIAESAIDRSALSPGGTGSYRLNNMRSINNALAARTPTSHHRHRLPSIGETPIDVEAPPLPNVVAQRSLPTPVDSGSEKEKGKGKQVTQVDEYKNEQPLLILSSARYDPTATPIRETPQTAVAPPTAIKYSSQSHPFAIEPADDNHESEPRPRTGSRSRKPDGLSIQTMQVQDEHEQSTSKRHMTTESYQTTHIDSTGGTTSPPTTGEMYRGGKSPSVSGRSLDQYISSLEQAQFYNQQPRARAYSNSSKPSKEGSSEKRSRYRNQPNSDEVRGRDERRIIPASKRSPSSPVPMSPEDVRLYSASVESLDSYVSNSLAMDRSNTPGSQSKSGRRRANSVKESKQGHRSRSRQAEKSSKSSSRGLSRQASPDPAPRSRGRSSSRKGASGRRSPSSPLPMVPSEEDRNGQDPALRLVSADRHRAHRSGSRHGSREPSSKRDQSPDRAKHIARSRSRQGEDREVDLGRRSSLSNRNDHSKRRHRRETSGGRSHKVEDSNELAREISNTTPLLLAPDQRSNTNPISAVDRRKKELAAAELEARRLSLARRPSVPNIPLPGQNTTHSKSASTGNAPPLVRANTDNILLNSRHGTSPANDPISKRPTTPRAMQVTPNSRIEEYGDYEYPEMLPGSVYQSPNPENGSRPASRNQAGHDTRQLPKHPAFDARIASSRSSSKTGDDRARSRSRGASRDRTRTSPQEDMMMIGSPPRTTTQTIHVPPILPELQHLASPPPPPPPPAPPKSGLFLNLRVDPEYAANIPLPMSAVPTIESPASANPYGHRRGRSGNESSQLINKFRSLTGRVRSTSRGRDNTTRSPQSSGENNAPRPYETQVGGPSPQLQQYQGFASMV